MCSACLFCFPVYFSLSPRGMVELLSQEKRAQMRCPFSGRGPGGEPEGRRQKAESRKRRRAQFCILRSRSPLLPSAFCIRFCLCLLHSFLPSAFCIRFCLLPSAFC